MYGAGENSALPRMTARWGFLLPLSECMYLLEARFPAGIFQFSNPFVRPSVRSPSGPVSVDLSPPKMVSERLRRRFVRVSLNFLCRLRTFGTAFGLHGTAFGLQSARFGLKFSALPFFAVSHFFFRDLPESAKIHANPAISLSVSPPRGRISRLRTTVAYSSTPRNTPF